MRPIIFIPGIEATAIVNANTFDFDVIWNAYDNLPNAIGSSLTGPQISEKLQKDPLYDEKISSLIERNHIARLPYRKSIENIQRGIPASQVYLFGYDWRLSNIENAKRLKAYTDMLKAKLAPQNVSSFDFVTHSMGGMLFSCFLNQLNNNYSVINKAVLCAPPFLGSPYALIHMVKGQGGLKSFLNKIFGNNEDIRKVVRTFPSIFELLPWYPQPLPFTYEDDGQPVDLLQMDDWQSNVYDDDPDLFRLRLSALAQYRNEGIMPLSKLDKDLRSRIIVLAGSGDDTFLRLKIRKKQDWIKNFVVIEKTPFSTGTGDGTVPYESATAFQNDVLTFNIKKDSLFDELSENIDFHGFFMSDSRVQNIIIRFLFDAQQLHPVLTERDGLEWWKSIGGTVTKAGNYSEV